MLPFLSEMRPDQVIEFLRNHPTRYRHDWEEWRGVYPAVGSRGHGVAACFGSILRKWQATRPLPMRRARSEANHSPPFLDDLLEDASAPLLLLQQTSVRAIAGLGPQQKEALDRLWFVFRKLPWRGNASCVGITKAVMLLTEGRIGPAFDSNVRRNLGLPVHLHPPVPRSPAAWRECLEAVARDIEAFERMHSVRLEDLVPTEWAPLNVGRVYDMVAGPGP